MTQHRRMHDFEANEPRKVIPTRNVSCHHLCDILEEYKTLEAQASTIYGIHQQSLWIENWAKHVNEDVHVLCIHENGHLVFALPFEVARCRTAWVGRYPAGVHSNANFPMMDRFSTQPTNEELDALKLLARQAAPKITALYFERQLQSHFGIENPILRHFAKVRSPNLALSASLDGGFDGILSRVNGKRRMKRHRQQTRRLETLGPIEFKIITEPQEIEETLDVYLDCKATQLADMGAPNTFEGQKHRAFMLANYLSSAEALKVGKPQIFAQQVLKVGDETRAILGTCLDRGGIHIEIATHRNDETAQYSAGEHLICESIQNACDRGLDFYDMGLGDQRYKRSWCKEETWHYDCMIPVALYGHYLVYYHKLKSIVKARIKENPKLWAFASRVRGVIGPITQKLRIK